MATNDQRVAGANASGSHAPGPPQRAQGSPTHPLLSCDSLEKYYGAVHALRGVSVDVWPGDFVALVGDNGAGKSTLVKILAGVTRPSAGTIRIDGAPAALSSPSAARRHGIETVYQDLGLCENLNVTENLFLGRELIRRVGPFRLLRRREMSRIAAEHLIQLVSNVPDPLTPVSELSGGQRQAIALARCRVWNQRLVMLDEPTAALGVQETRNSVETIREIHRSGTAVVLISHDIPLVMELATRVVVLRRGEKVGDVATSQISEHDIVAMITGAATILDEPPRPVAEAAQSAPRPDSPH